MGIHLVIGYSIANVASEKVKMLIIGCTGITADSGHQLCITYMIRLFQINLQIGVFGVLRLGGTIVKYYVEGIGIAIDYILGQEACLIIKSLSVVIIGICTCVFGEGNCIKFCV